MLLGKQNSINQKLVFEISQVFPLQFVEYNEEWKNFSSSLKEKPNVVVLNLMDVEDDEKVLTSLKEQFKNVKIIGVHCFENEDMIALTLEKGVDEYLSIFEFSENIIPTLDKLGVKRKNQ